MLVRHRNAKGTGTSRRSSGAVLICLASLALLFVLAMGGVALAKAHQQVFGEIAPAGITASTFTDQVLTVTLTDKHGDPVAGQMVEWFMQGVGFFRVDSAEDTNSIDDPNVNRDIDMTDAQGQAMLHVKSYVAGEQLIYLRYREKPKQPSGSELPIVLLTATVTWVEQVE